MNKHDKSRQRKCKWCDKIFVEKQTLEHHLERQAGKGDHPSVKTSSAAFECPFDGCSFSSSKGNCRTHCMRIHVAEETAALLERGDEISCRHCSETFNSLGQFYYHSLKCVHLPATDARKPLLAQLA
jgi:hypothetical protein